MLLIFISWIYVLFVTVNLGFTFNKIFKIQSPNFVTTVFLGLFSVTLLASTFAIFSRINIEFHIFIFILNLITLFFFSKEILNTYLTFFNQLKGLSRSLQLYLIVITFLIIAQCSTIPYILDNESYYIQTIKWLNEYGFVRGLVNLHPFLGQMSGWHIAQSALNFSFLYSGFNDLSGFCLLLGNVFAIQKLQEYFKNQNKIYLIMGLLPLANFFFFQFISAPSPDIPIYIVSFLMLFYFLENFEKPSIHDFNIIVILTLFLIYIKSTAVSFAIIPISLFLLNFKILSRNLLKSFTISLFVLILFITKNIIVCGTPIYPTHLLDIFNRDYALPSSIEHFFYTESKAYGYLLDLYQYQSMTSKELFFRWLSLPKLSGLFNKISVLLVLICPFLIYRFENKMKIWILYLTMVVQLLLMLITSPQYRYFMNFILFFSLFSLVYYISKKKPVTSLLVLSVIPIVIVLFLPINLNQFSNNKFALKSCNFSAVNFIYPSPNTKYDTAFEVIKKGNMKYNSPIRNDFFWGNGNGNLPCINKAQIDYFETYYNFIPQLRSSNLKDGFYAKKVSSSSVRTQNN